MKNLKKLGFAFLSGVVGAFAFAPYYIFPLLIASFCSLIYLLFHSQSYKESFLIGWIFGFGYFLGGLYWISYPLIFYFLGFFWWLVPFAIMLIPCTLALYSGVCAVILHKLNNGNKIAFSIYFLCIWVFFEFLRNKLLTGFPWLIAGYSLVNWPELIQLAAWGGLFSLSFIALFCPVICFLLIEALIQKKWTKGSAITCLALIIIFLANALYGWNRLNTSETRLSSRDKVKIIQPNISTLLKRSTMDERAEQIINLAKLNPAEDSGLLYVLFAEGGLNSFTKEKLTKLIQATVPKHGYLIGGGDRVDYSRRIAWNSAFIINHNGEVLDIYDKTHLVPFGEYIPLKEELSVGLNAIVSAFSNGFIDFSRGSGPRTLLQKTKFPFSPSICYESLFSRDVVKKDVRGVRPQLLINFTTDMWYKDSSGPYQHFDMSALRAVEYGIPMIRVAATGISGIVDPYGRVLAKLPLNTRGTISNYVPLALTCKTFYTAHGDTPILSLLIGAFLLTFIILHVICNRFKEK